VDAPPKHHSKSETLADVFDPKRNAFGAARAILAIFVIYSHCYALGGFGMDPLQRALGRGITFGTLGVSLFFTLSGFLITRSASRTNTGRFLWHRFLRIFPGYWVCLIVCAFVIAPLIFQFEYGRVSRMFAVPNASPQGYVLRNLTVFDFHGRSLSKVLTLGQLMVSETLHRNPYPLMLNGSLWTLPFELLCYLSIAVVSLVGALQQTRRALLAAFFLVWGLITFQWLEPASFQAIFPPFAGSLFMLVLYFLSGALAFLYRNEVGYSRVRLGLCGLVLLSGAVVGWSGIIAPLTLPYLFLWLTCKLPLQRFEKRGDYSYGLYIYAFPIQQTLAFFQLPAAGFLTYFLSAILLTTLCAMVSHHLVEAPCLRFKNVDPRAVLGLFHLGRRSIELARPAASSTAP
jgi:peptidoglycan/LPS O-acetylase OafA/YrhL